MQLDRIVDIEIIGVNELKDTVKISHLFRDHGKTLKCYFNISQQ